MIKNVEGEGLQNVAGAVRCVPEFHDDFVESRFQQGAAAGRNSERPRPSRDARTGVVAIVECGGLFVDCDAVSLRRVESAAEGGGPVERLVKTFGRGRPGDSGAVSLRDLRENMARRATTKALISLMLRFCGAPSVRGTHPAMIWSIIGSIVALLNHVSSALSSAA